MQADSSRKMVAMVVIMKNKLDEEMEQWFSTLDSH